ncbi:hypothetical protein [Streptomyces sp. NPDC055060]
MTDLPEWEFPKEMRREPDRNEPSADRRPVVAQLPDGRRILLRTAAFRVNEKGVIP